MSDESFMAPTPEELDPLFPSYTVSSFIAQGGMGAVYLATQTSLERAVAIKILPRELGQNTEFRASFSAEAKAMAKLNHPNLIGVFDYGEVDGMLYIVMEYVAGKSLYDFANGSRIDPMEAARLVQDMLHGLHHAHEHGVLHRDVKPANILLDGRNVEPKLGDFGLAMTASAGGTDSSFFGTPGYAAPEIYEGRPGARSDIYAAAVLLYELLTGKMPENPYQHPSTVCQCSPRFDNVLSIALQPDPNARFQTAGEFAKALETIRNSPKLDTETGTESVVKSSPAVSQNKAILSQPKKGNSGALVTAIIGLVAVGGCLFLLVGKSQEIEADAGDPLSKVESQHEKAEIEPAKRRKKDLAEPRKGEPKGKITEVVKGSGRVDFAIPQEVQIILIKTRRTCANDIKPVATEYRRKIKENIKNLEQAAEKLLSRQKNLSEGVKKKRLGQLKLLIKTYRERGSLPPSLNDSLPAELSELSDDQDAVRATIEEFLLYQNGLWKTFQGDLEAPLTDYTDSLEEQAQQFLSEGEKENAKLLKAEIALVQTKPSYFAAIAHGKSPTLVQPAVTVELPRKKEVAEPGISNKFWGQWKNRTGNFLFTVKEDGTIERGEDKGTWEVEGEKLILTWGSRVDVVAFVGKGFQKLEGQGQAGQERRFFRVGSF